MRRDSQRLHERRVMDDLQTLLNRTYWFIIIAVACLVSAVKTLSKPRATIGGYLLAFLSGFIGAILFCYLGAEITLYFTGSSRFGLAVGGFFAWQGGDWIKKLVEKIINDKFSKKSTFDDEDEQYEQ